MARNLVIITGGSSGIGLALAESVPWPDAQVVDVSRRGGPGSLHVRADLADPAHWPPVRDLFEKEVAGFEGERVALFHCAGTLTPIGFAGEVDGPAYARNVLLNSAAPQVLGDAFLRAAQRTQARCQLVMIGSGAATNVYEGWSSYCAGKAAVDHWVRTVGAEQQRRGDHVHVMSVAPGVVATAMQEEIRDTQANHFPDLARFVGLHEGGELRDPKAVAADLWALLDRQLENGSVLDLRDA